MHPVTMHTKNTAKRALSDKTIYWLKLAKEDLDTARILFRKKRYLFSGFLCHLTIEKGLKAIVANSGATAPKTHDLVKLAKLGDAYAKMDDNQKDHIDTLLPLNIEARYPTYKDNIVASLDKASCKEIIKNTEVLLKWIEKQL